MMLRAKSFPLKLLGRQAAKIGVTAAPPLFFFFILFCGACELKGIWPLVFFLGGGSRRGRWLADTCLILGSLGGD
jgi:hypothetical protein